MDIIYGYNGIYMDMMGYGYYLWISMDISMDMSTSRAKTTLLRRLLLLSLGNPMSMEVYSWENDPSMVDFSACHV